MPRRADSLLQTAGTGRGSLGVFATAALLLFASGVAALIFQVLWIKQLSLVVGVEVYAITIAVSGFFGGLAAGGLVLGRWVDHASRPVRFYVWLEAGVALLGVATTLVLARAAPWFAAIELHSGLLAWAMVFVIVGIPPFLMGGTLPTLVRAIATGSEGVSRTGGSLYAANTAGAIAGALLPAFVLVPAFGVQGTALAAAALNLVAAGGALALDRAVNPRAVVSDHGEQAPYSSDARLAIGLYAIAGGIALGYEIIWSQTIVQFMSTRSFAFSVVLATYLAGLAAGAALFARWAHRVRDPWSVFGLLIAAAGLVALVEVAVLGQWLLVAQTMVEAVVYRTTESEFAGMCARFAVAALCIVFLPTLLLGAAFPAALRLIVGDARIGRDVGTVVGLNTIGGIVGTVLTGFVLVPLLGLVRSLAALAIAAGLVGLIAVARSPAVARTTRWIVAALCVASVVAAVMTPMDQLARLLPAARGGGLSFYEESPGGTVAVVGQSTGTNRFHRLYIQGVSNSGDAMPSLRYMRLQALLPLIIHNGDPKAALVIGYGTGITAGALSQFPGLERRVVSELLPAVLRAAPQFEGTFGGAADPKLEVRLRDGRRELQRSLERYDLVTLEPPPPSAAGVVNLYSSDFYRLAGSRLQEKGIVAQWLPLPTQNDEDTRSLVRSFIDVFPHASLWTTELHEMLLVGSHDPLELDVPRIVQRFSQPDTAAALGAVGIGSPATLLATWVTDRAGLARFAGDAPAVTDDRPRIEYATWVRPREFSRVFAHLQQYRTDPVLKNGPPDFAAAVAVEREQLDTFYRAGLSVYSGDRAQYARDMGRIMRDGASNPYYSWFVAPRRQ
jgi:spermidine synthase